MMRIKITFLINILTITLFSQQINIPRIEEMPAFPEPYEMRDWKQVTAGYDSLVFDLTKTGDYLPLVWIDGNSINYPNHDRFGLHTAVGNTGAEAINILPAVISASLIGIDKSDQRGHNWVLMCEEFFNKRASENIYLNNFLGNSGHDWWYDTMPNIYFYMLYDIYGTVGDFEYQFTTVADRWLAAVQAMDGSATPWTVPYMNYRAWKMATMEPLESGVRQPEAAGAIAWILYHAYTQTGDNKYRIGAEWCLEFLNEWQTNPAYELQLPFGVYTAAKMNVELGTNYNIEKLLNWCFTPEGNVRHWGACLGNWGGYDCDGLIGEAKYDGYAFFMNGADQFGALVPMVRYDNRFARTIGKWALNVANASRLFYTNYLPDANQDGESWAHQYDPNSYIAHEALREFALNTGVSPFATGDFIRSGWGPSNYVLYGSSHVGMFGGIIDTTNIEGVLQLDLLKTDFFQDKALQSYLYYNPHEEAQNVAIDPAGTVVDLYDCVANEMIATGVSGITNFSIASDAARIIVLLPAGTQLNYQFNKTLAGDIVIDYSSGQSVDNYPPRIKSLAPETSTVEFQQAVKIYCTAEDRDEDELAYTWQVEKDTLAETEKLLQWTAPDSAGFYNIFSIVKDSNGETVSDTIQIEVTESINHAPVIDKIEPESSKIIPEESTIITCFATDEDGDELTYSWSAEAGEIAGSDSVISWTAPNNTGNYQIFCRVSDGRGGSATESITILVREENSGEFDPLLFLPFDGNANDISGYGHHGTVNGAILTVDYSGNADAAYQFDGLNDNILIANTNELNFQTAISVCFWMNIGELFNREAFPISHGSWENRWKISIIPEHKLRWTIKTSAGIIDLDSATKLAANTWYHIVALYNGDDVEIYINNELNSHTGFSGEILTTDIDLTIGQMLPSNNAYNFKGIIDDVRIFDAAISESLIDEIYRGATGIGDNGEKILPDHYNLSQNYPNPFNPVTKISYQLPENEFVTLEIYDVLGEKIAVLVAENQAAGNYDVQWHSSNSSSGIYFYKLQTKSFVDIKKCLKLK